MEELPPEIIKLINSFDANRGQVESVAIDLVASLETPIFSSLRNVTADNCKDALQSIGEQPFGNAEKILERYFCITFLTEYISCSYNNKEFYETFKGRKAKKFYHELFQKLYEGWSKVFMNLPLREFSSVAEVDCIFNIVKGSLNRFPDTFQYKHVLNCILRQFDEYRTKVIIRLEDSSSEFKSSSWEESTSSSYGSDTDSDAKIFEGMLSKTPTSVKKPVSKYQSDITRYVRSKSCLELDKSSYYSDSTSSWSPGTPDAKGRKLCNFPKKPVGIKGKDDTQLMLYIGKDRGSDSESTEPLSTPKTLFGIKHKNFTLHVNSCSSPRSDSETNCWSCSTGVSELLPILKTPITAKKRLGDREVQPKLVLESDSTGYGSASTVNCPSPTDSDVIILDSETENDTPVTKARKMDINRFFHHRKKVEEDNMTEKKLMSVEKTAPSLMINKKINAFDILMRKTTLKRKLLSNFR